MGIVEVSAAGLTKFPPEVDKYFIRAYALLRRNKSASSVCVELRCFLREADHLAKVLVAPGDRWGDQFKDKQCADLLWELVEKTKAEVQELRSLWWLRA